MIEIENYFVILLKRKIVLCVQLWIIYNYSIIYSIMNCYLEIYSLFYGYLKVWLQYLNRK